MNKPLRTLCLATPFDYSCATVFEDLFDGVTSFVPGKTSFCADDVMVFDGGEDIHPTLYHEQPSPFTTWLNPGRDQIERQAFIRAQSVGAACIGVCRGAQLLCALSGGRLIQHVTNHQANHPIVAYTKEVMETDSTHHQQMWPGFADHELLAVASHLSESYCEYGKDFHSSYQPEIVWFPQTRSLCIQGHPEYMDSKSRFYQFCRELVKTFILNEKVKK